MVKTRNICLDDDIHERLKQEDNASHLINALLTDHYNTKILKDAIDINDITNEENEARERLEELQEKKKQIADRSELIEKATEKLGKSCPELILLLERIDHEPDTETSKVWRSKYGIESVTNIWQSWRILHGKEL